MGGSKLFMNLLVTQYARDLRKNLTDAEERLWQLLRKKQLGVRFRRQVPLGKYILDFACFDPKIIIEIDGGQHADPRAELYDQQRTAWLESHGYKILRFWNNEVLGEIENVVEEILKNI